MTYKVVFSTGTEVEVKADSVQFTGTGKGRALLLEKDTGDTVFAAPLQKIRYIQLVSN